MHQITRKQLGSTGVEIPVIGFGTWNYSGGVLPLVTAIEQGATFIDTAETYGSEEVVGKSLKGRRAEVFLATKIRPANFRKRDVIRAVEGSLRRLETDYIDLYQLHWPNYTVPIEETMAAMESLADHGKIRYIGVSNFSAKELIAAQRCLGKHRIVSNQVRYSLIDRTIEDGLLQHCQREQVTVIAFSPLGTDFKSLCQHDREGLLSALAKKYGKNEAQIALNWLVEKSGVVVITKASAPQHVIDDCGACGWRLDKADYELLTSRVRFHRRGPIERFARRWGKSLFQRFGRAV